MITLVATVSPPAAAGTVQFKDGANNIGDAVAIRNGRASQTASTLVVGSHQLTATFIPISEALYSDSTSSAVTFVISGATAHQHHAGHLTRSPSPRGTPVTMTATVVPSAAAGTVQFRDGTTNVSVLR